MHGTWRAVGDGTEGEQVPLLNGDGVQLVDGHGQVKSLDWDLLRDQHGYTVYDANGDLCFEETNKDMLALLTWPVCPPMPISAEQAHYVVEQNQQLQCELDQALLAHWNDAE